MSVIELNFEVTLSHGSYEKNSTSITNDLKSLLAHSLEVDESSIEISFQNEALSRTLSESKNISIRIRVTVEQLPEEKKQEVLGILDPRKFTEDINTMIMKTATMANKGIRVTKSEQPILQSIEGIIKFRFTDLLQAIIIILVPSSR